MRQPEAGLKVLSQDNLIESNPDSPPDSNIGKISQDENNVICDDQEHLVVVSPCHVLVDAMQAELERCTQEEDAIARSQADPDGFGSVIVVPVVVHELPGATPVKDNQVVDDINEEDALPDEVLMHGRLQ